MILLFFRMDSFVLAEMFKYLFLLYSEPEDLVLNIDDYIFTTEAHVLPLTLSIYSTVPNNTGVCSTLNSKNKKETSLGLRLHHTE